MQQYGSVESQYDWMIAGLPGEHWKPLGRPANCCAILVSTSSIPTDTKDDTYPSSPASPNIVRQPLVIHRIAHENSRLDGSKRSTREGSARPAAERAVHDLTALGVSDQDDLGVGAPLVEGCNGADHGGGPLASRILVAHTAALGLPTAGGIDDRFPRGAGVGLGYHVD